MADSTPIAPLLLTEAQAARAMGVSVRTMFSLRRRGLAFLKIGSKTLYRPGDLERWIDERMVTTAVGVEGTA
jgi:Helix-turn-helix domain